MMAKSFSELKKGLSPRRQAQIESEAEQILLRLALQELRRHRQLTQQELADIMQVKQAALSKMENQRDIRVSTLRKLVAGMGGRLKLVAEFPDGEVIIDQF
jgi:transcriptional regulator with XRE-family HTH domain